MGARKLTQEEQDIAFEYALQGVSLAKTAKTLGFSNDMAFHRYCLNDPVFAKELDAMRARSCPHLEDKMLEIPETCGDAKIGRVQMEVLGRILAYRNPLRYGNKVDITMTQTVDIGSSLARMQSRLAATYASQIDVTPIASDINDLL